MNPLSGNGPAHQIRAIDAKKTSGLKKLAVVAAVSAIALGVITALASAHGGALAHLLTGHAHPNLAQLMTHVGSYAGIVAGAGAFTGYCISSIANQRRTIAKYAHETRVETFKKNPPDTEAKRVEFQEDWKKLSLAEQKDLWDALTPDERQNLKDALQGDKLLNSYDFPKFMSQTERTAAENEKPAQ